MAALPLPSNLPGRSLRDVAPERQRRARLIPVERVYPSTASFPPSPCRLIHGDNLEVIQTLLDEGYAGKVNLIYIDPPFDSRSDYRHRILLDGTKIIREAPLVDRLAYQDTWEGGIEAYLSMLAPRLRLMTKLLSEDGNLFIHLDHRRVHYVKVLMDGILPDGFLNEIIWHFNSGARERNSFGRRHHTILRYAKNPGRAFLDVESPHARTPYSPNINIPACKAHYYHPMGKIHDDVWDIDLIPQNDRSEREGFATQKPLALLKRIVGSCSRPGDLVADFFCGSGTTPAAAEELDRRWIAVDQSAPAVQVTRRRLLQPELFGFVVERDQSNMITESIHGISVQAVRSIHTNLVTVRLLDYSLPEIPIKDDRQKERTREILHKDFAYALDSWSVDTESENGVFCSRYCRYRNGKRDVAPVEKEIRDILIPNSIDYIGVRIVDVFGDETTTRVPIIPSAQPEA
ncbi:MAG: site-specific DNA-methyltransferase [bacterium]